MTNWGDAKKFIFEDIVVYSLVAVIAILWDFFINFFDAVNLIMCADHPYSFGTGQLIVFFIAVIQLVRSFYRWRFYA